MQDKVLEAAIDSIKIQRDAVDYVLNNVDQKALVAAIDLISSSPRVVTCASGSSGFAAGKFSHSLCCVEISAKYMYPSEAVHGGLGFIKKDDVVIMISRGGKTAELLPIIDVVKKKEATLIGLTENLDSVLANASDVVIPMPITRESDPLNIMATTSNLVVGLILDAILSGIIVKTGFTLEQFGLIHPGGAVGETLGDKVK
ncbi:MAG TPA: SIS domain-containing protein [Clostridiaceae bacterium]|nr:SIS domain-containing protein [Clostridiaceae bacterium]